MIYEPINKSIDQILNEAGFTKDHDGSRGWIRPTTRVKVYPREGCIVLRSKYRLKTDPGHRMHAIINDGKIDLHYDFNRNKKHEVYRRSGLVKKCIEEFKKIDV